MNITDKISTELEYFKKLHESYSIKLGVKEKLVKDLDENILYMLLSASLAMDINEDEFFESFTFTDKSIAGKEEYLIDGYAFINTEDTKLKHLHVFQFKIHTDNSHSASPKEVYAFASLINDIFLHPELDHQNKNPVINEIKNITESFLKNNPKNKVKYKCHYINNAKGITRSNEKDFELLNRFDYDKETHGFDVQVYGISEIEDLAIDGKIRVGLETITIENENPNSYRYENNKEKTGLGLPGQTIVGMINVNELIRLQNKYHRNQLYSENIRLYLGDRGTVNKDIISTITSNESQWFPYMNNGISIICDNLSLGTPKSKGINIEMKNMQIINGCQTVNALYNAKYNEESKDNFRPSKVLVKIYEIEPNQERFKLAIIKATNNQNAVKTFSLVANDPIQIEIQNKLEKLGYLYDRKGEAKNKSKDIRVINMVNASLAYRAVFWFEGKKLRSGIGQGRVFKNEEYKKLFKSEYLEKEYSYELNKLSVELVISTIILEKIRLLINMNSEKYKSLPVFKKSLYYLSGLYFAKYKNEIDQLIQEIIKLIDEGISQKIRNFDKTIQFEKNIESNFDQVVYVYKKFYENLNLDKTDIDNLLKSNDFDKQYRQIEIIKSAIDNSKVEN